MGERPMIGFSMFGQKFIIRKVRITNPKKGDNLWIETREYSINYKNSKLCTGEFSEANPLEVKKC
jgi:hypothetical protein